MNLKPIGHRILVLPDDQLDETASGLVLPENRDHVATSGTVVALGPGGSLVRHQARNRAIRDCCEFVESAIFRHGAVAALTLLRDELAGLLGTADAVRDVAVGDRVVFPAEVGHRLAYDGVEYIELNEDDVAVVVAEAHEDVAA